MIVPYSELRFTEQAPFDRGWSCQRGLLHATAPCRPPRALSRVGGHSLCLSAELCRPQIWGTDDLLKLTSITHQVTTTWHHMCSISHTSFDKGFEGRRRHRVDAATACVTGFAGEVQVTERWPLARRCCLSAGRSTLTTLGLVDK